MIIVSHRGYKPRRSVIITGFVQEPTKLIMKVLDRTIEVTGEPQIFGDTGAFKANLTKTSDRLGLKEYALELTSDIPSELPKGLIVQWRLPSVNIKGEWGTGHLYEKRLRADWEHPSVLSRVSVNAPVVSLFGHEDENIIAIACSDVINTMGLEAPVREEDDHVYCTVSFFLEKMPLNTSGKIDRKALPAPSKERPSLEDIYKAPSSDLEKLRVLFKVFFVRLSTVETSKLISFQYLSLSHLFLQKLNFIQVPIIPILLFKKFIVSPLFYNFTSIHNNNLVCFFNGR